MWQIARWEFRRYFKLRQQLIGLAVTAAIGLVSFGLVRLADRDRAIEVAVIGADILPLTEHAPEDLTFTPHAAADAQALREAVLAGDREALLVVTGPDSAQLFTRRRGEWVGRLEGTLAAARQQVALRASGIAPETVAALFSPPALDVQYASGEQRGARRTERIALLITLGVMIMTIFTGMSYIFASITGEKQLRVTEQVISAIPAQAWIDGKILGLTAVSLANVLNLALVSAVLMVVLRAVGTNVPLPTSVGDPAIVGTIVLFGLLGLFFWFAFLAAIAAMIDDPHTSSRGSFLFVPMFASSLAFFALGNPDSGLVRTLALLPPTSPGAMPARMLLTEVPPLEVALSLALLFAAVALLRIAAGRVFRLAMLMYGKEPTWREVRRWLLEP